MKIETYDQLIDNLNGLLMCAHEEGRLDNPEDVATMEFVVSWFEANEDDVREFLEGSN
jgi:hypothetical protein